MSTRWTLKLKGGRHIKIRKGEIYNATLDDGTCVKFQEQLGHVGEPVHTHIWVEFTHPDLVLYFVSYVLEDAIYHPHKMVMVAFLQYWDLTNGVAEPVVEAEMVLHRKLSNTLFQFVSWWVEQIVEALNGYAAMTSLFDPHC